MARQFDVNLFTVGGHYAGPFFLALKDLAVLCGWAVRGSGEGTGGSRFAYDGVTAALPADQQGSGGAYDCWKEAAARTDSTPLVSGDVGNAGAWCVLENNGVEVLLAHTTGTGVNSWCGYGRIAFNPGTGATSAFDGTIAAAGTLPGAATNEQWMHGTRGADTEIVTYAAHSYAHLWGDDSLGAGGISPFGFITVKASDNTARALMSIATFETGSTLAADPSPVAVFYGTSATYSTTLPTGKAWCTTSGAVDTVSNNYHTNWAANGNPYLGKDFVRRIEVVLPSTVGSRESKGFLTKGSLAISSAQRGWGRVMVDNEGDGWIYFGGSLLVPWPADGTLPLP